MVADEALHAIRLLMVRRAPRVNGPCIGKTGKLNLPDAYRARAIFTRSATRFSHWLESALYIFTWRHLRGSITLGELARLACVQMGVQIVFRPGSETPFRLWLLGVPFLDCSSSAPPFSSSSGSSTTKRAVQPGARNMQRRTPLSMWTSRRQLKSPRCIVPPNGEASSCF